MNRATTSQADANSRLPVGWEWEPPQPPRRRWPSVLKVICVLVALATVAAVAVVVAVRPWQTPPGDARTVTPSSAAPVAPASPPSSGRLTPTGGRPFKANGPWNTSIPGNAAVDPLSDNYVRRLRSGPVATDIYEFGDPVFAADADTPLFTISCGKSPDWGPCPFEGLRVPIPDTARPDGSSDAGMVVVDFSTGRVYDFWRMRETSTGWAAGWGAVTSLDASGAAVAGNGGDRGSGLPRLGGLIRTWEIADGVIPHALEVSSDATCSMSFRYPANRADGADTSFDCIPEGARLQLDPTLDLSTLKMTPAERTIATAMQRYGAYVADSGGTPLAIGFENPMGKADTFAPAGLEQYGSLPGIPWDRLRVVR